MPQVQCWFSSYLWLKSTTKGGKLQPQTALAGIINQFGINGRRTFYNIHQTLIRFFPYWWKGHQIFSTQTHHTRTDMVKIGKIIRYYQNVLAKPNVWIQWFQSKYCVRSFHGNKMILLRLFHFTRVPFWHLIPAMSCVASSRLTQVMQYRVMADGTLTIPNSIPESKFYQNGG